MIVAVSAPTCRQFGTFGGPTTDGLLPGLSWLVELSHPDPQTQRKKIDKKAL
jgi:hypothetical protein